MHDELQAAMKAIEALDSVPSSLSREQHWAALAGLGSKFLAIGAPETIGLLHCGGAAGAIYRCHELQFGPLKIRSAGDHALDGSADIFKCSSEESLACDLVCLTTTSDFSPEWIADATHLNIIDDGPWSPGMQSLAAQARLTWVGTPRHALSAEHGPLNDVIRGSVSGRVSEEITCLLWTPDENAG